MQKAQFNLENQHCFMYFGRFNIDIIEVIKWNKLVQDLILNLLLSVKNSYKFIIICQMWYSIILIFKSKKLIDIIKWSKNKEKKSKTGRYPFSFLQTCLIVAFLCTIHRMQYFIIIFIMGHVFRSKANLALCNITFILPSCCTGIERKLSKLQIIH